MTYPTAPIDPNQWQSYPAQQPPPLPPQPPRGGNTALIALASVVVVLLVLLVVGGGVWLLTRGPATPAASTTTPPVTVTQTQTPAQTKTETVPAPAPAQQPAAPVPADQGEPNTTVSSGGELFTVCPSGRVGVATSVTSCAFADNVGSAYRSTGSSVITAYSPVTGQNYTMSGDSITITFSSGGSTVGMRYVGGNNAVVIAW
ncbi:hypothetical protein ACWDTI_05020 [Gordonia sp. NPDC003424]